MKYKLILTGILSLLMLALYVGWTIVRTEPFFGDSHENGVVMILKFIGLIVGGIIAPFLPFILLGNWIMPKESK